jgi:hypothetical protein
VVKTSNRFGEPLKALISKGLWVTGVRKFPQKGTHLVESAPLPNHSVHISSM